VYSCPMHPEVVQAEPGRCPDCGMFLEEREASPDELATVFGASQEPDIEQDNADHAGHDHAGHDPGTAAAEQAAYSCPMHPEVLSEGPGKCPKCGMFLERTGDAEHEHQE